MSHPAWIFIPVPLSRSLLAPALFVLTPAASRSSARPSFCNIPFSLSLSPPLPCPPYVHKPSLPPASRPLRLSAICPLLDDGTL
ncbi:hypothetical protein C8Q70DRAFT_145975 [Cubamyces menziesii]|nr:hypothetical protein C8Q70DRAFT_145975 [Cubamyces menziesii]